MELTHEQLAAKQAYEAAKVVFDKAAREFREALKPSTTPRMRHEAFECVESEVMDGFGGFDDEAGWFAGLVAEELARYIVDAEWLEEESAAPRS